MCEWLSCVEWSDVHLLCGGRVFSAHRAVLASVSTFLREVLLSCPNEETPTFIVLPEFDLDIISLVLYYIYNGEVIIKKNQLKRFLDTTNAMQIFVNSQILPNDSEIGQIENKSSNPQTVVPDTIAASNYKTIECVNLKRRVNVPDELDSMQNNENTKDSDKDKRQNSPGISELKSTSRYLQSQWRDRQRHPFSRDLFIETYSVNSNNNGLTEGVLEISNKDYHVPTSVLLMNANVDYLRVKEGFSKKNHKKSENLLSSLFDHQDHIYNMNDKKCSINYHSDLLYRYQYNIKTDLVNTNSFHEHSKLENIRNECKSKDSLLKIIPSKKQTSNNLHQLNCNIDRNDDISTNLKYKEKVRKLLIHNEVLHNPWRSRQPHIYAAFLKKSSDLIDCQQNCDNTINEQQLSIQDKINNYRTTVRDIDTISLTEKESCKQYSNISFTCNFCEQVFSDSVIFDAHIKQHMGSRYKCLECNKSFSQLRNYKYHMSVHRGSKEFATNCPVCGKYFNDKGYLSSHMKIHRNRKEYKCSVCPKSFNQRVAYNMHVRIHTGVKPHVCAECGKAFSRRTLLKLHRRTHSGERPYACPHCDKRFADRSNMTLHLRLHTGIKPFSCSICAKSFTKKHHLKSHLNFHSGEKPYPCPRCNLGFTQSSNMRTHLKKCNPSTLPENNNIL